MSVRTVLRWFKKRQAIIREKNYPLYRMIRRGGVIGLFIIFIKNLQMNKGITLQML